MSMDNTTTKKNYSFNSIHCEDWKKIYANVVHKSVFL